MEKTPTGDVGAKLEFLFGPALITHYRLQEGIQSREADQTVQRYASARKGLEEIMPQLRQFEGDPLIGKLWAEIVTKGQQLEDSINRTGYFTKLMVPEIDSNRDVDEAYDQMCSLFHTYLQVLDIRERLQTGERLAEVGGPTETEVALTRIQIASAIMEENRIGERYPILNPMLEVVSGVANDLQSNRSKYFRQGQRKKARKGQRKKARK